MATIAIVLDANILIRAVLGTRVRELIFQNVQKTGRNSLKMFGFQAPFTGSLSAFRKPIFPWLFEAANLDLLQPTNRKRRRWIENKCSAAGMWWRRTGPLGKRPRWGVQANGVPERTLASWCAHAGRWQAHHACVFANRRADRLKVLVFDGVGMWLCTRRLQSGRLNGHDPMPASAAPTAAR